MSGLEVGGRVSPMGSPIQKRGARYGSNVPMITELGLFLKM